VAEQLYFIRSHKHDQHDLPGSELATWWCPDSKGYTYDLAKAGQYTEAEALNICGPFGVPIVKAKPRSRTYDSPDNIAYPIEMVSPLSILVVSKYDVENARMRELGKTGVPT
jgi:hypothetical protein